MLEETFFFFFRGASREKGLPVGSLLSRTSVEGRKEREEARGAGRDATTTTLATFGEGRAEFLQESGVREPEREPGTNYLLERRGNPPGGGQV